VSRTHFSEDLSQHVFFEQMGGPQTHTMLRNHHEYSTKRKAPHFDKLASMEVQGSTLEDLWVAFGSRWALQGCTDATLLGVKFLLETGLPQPIWKQLSAVTVKKRLA
jgi:hypothetical protein